MCHICNDICVTLVVLRPSNNRFPSFFSGHLWHLPAPMRSFQSKTKVDKVDCDLKAPANCWWMLAMSPAIFEVGLAIGKNAHGNLHDVDADECQIQSLADQFCKHLQETHDVFKMCLKKITVGWCHRVFPSPKSPKCVSFKNYLVRAISTVANIIIIYCQKRWHADIYFDITQSNLYRCNTQKHTKALFLACGIQHTCSNIEFQSDDLRNPTGTQKMHSYKVLKE